MAKVNMQETEYYKSGKHRENYLIAAAKAKIAQANNKAARVAEYEASPTHCLQCKLDIPYTRRHHQFCNSSCAAKYNNARRPPMTDAIRQKIRTTLKEASKKPPTERQLAARARARSADRPKRLVSITCVVCKLVRDVPFCKRGWKTCGATDCKVQASVGVRTYQNGSRKPEWYFNKCENKEVLLESSWEVKVAQALDGVGIDWIRPKFIKWTDSTGKVRRYFPDFYLPKFDVYLDPKNPYCMMLDREKMEQISKQVVVIFGPVDDVIKAALRLITD